MSTFQGIEMARKALFAQQGGLYTTGHNISNVNTPGYSRQRVAFNTTTPFPMPSRVMPQIAGQLGTGVEIGVVERIRNQFLDFQFRAENSRLGYFDTKSDALSRLENLLNEPSDTGLTHIMDRFWQSLQDLATNPDNSGAREVVAERGLALAETFNYLSKSMQSIQKDLKDQIDVNVDDINSLLRQINDLNKQIQKLEPHGLLTNDLYDERDRLIDELSQHLNIKVHYRASSESALDIADGLASIELVDEHGNSIGDEGVFLIDVRTESPTAGNVVRELSISPHEADDPIACLSIEGYNYNVDDVSFINAIKETGRLSALIESYGYMDNGEAKGDYPFYLEQLDKMAQKFAEAFNSVHEDGANLEDNEGRAFFVSKDENNATITAEKDRKSVV